MNISRWFRGNPHEWMHGYTQFLRQLALPRRFNEAKQRFRSIFLQQSTAAGSLVPGTKQKGFMSDLRVLGGKKAGIDILLLFTKVELLIG